MNRRITRAERIGMIVLAIAIAALGLVLCLVRQDPKRPAVVPVPDEIPAPQSPSVRDTVPVDPPSFRPSPIDRPLSMSR